MAQLPNRKALRERFNISRFAIQYPWPTLGFWIAIMVAGFLAFSSLKYALFPDITFPVVVVNAAAPFTNAPETEAKLTQPLEKQLQTLAVKQGLTKIRSTSYPGRSILSLSFEVGTGLESSADQVEATLKQVKLPTDATYEVNPINLNESAVISYAIGSSQQTLPELTKTAQTTILPAIAKLPGVLKVNLLGIPAGVKVTEFAKNNAVEKNILQPGSSAVRFKGKDVLALEVVKKSDANTLEVVREVEQSVQTLRSNLPNAQMTLAATQAEYINEATHATVEALILAIILSVIVIFPFLWNWKATIISALAIPTSLFGTFIVMAIFGFNLETITLLALALVIGIIVDDAIVDVENIARHIELGEPPRQAAITATNEIGLTVTAATLTIVAVFLPVALMEGVVGQFFRPFGITVSASVVISLLVARTLSPLLAAYWLKPKRVREDTLQSGEPLPEDGEHGLTGDRPSGFVNGYRTLLDWSLRHRKAVVGIAILSFAAGMALIPFISTGFIPKLDRGEFNITYTAPLPKVPNPAALARAAQAATASNQSPQGLPPGVNPADLAAGKIPRFDPLTESVDVAKKLEAAVRKSPFVESVFTTVGTRQQPNKGMLHVKLRRDRTVRTAEAQDQIRRTLPAIAGVTTSVEDIQFVDTGGEKPLQIALIGDDPLVLSTIAKDIKRRVEKLPGFADIAITGAANDDNKIVEIERVAGRRVAYVSANLGKEMALGRATRQVEAIARDVIAKEAPAKPVVLDRGSDSARVDEIFDSFKITLGLAVLCIVLVLVLLFKSLVDPLVIALSLPLAIVGALMASLLTRSDFGMISVIGIIFLLGLTNKNAILLVDYINQLRNAGFSRTEAILKAGPVRLRPILMTTAATILGMLPIALGIGAGAELRAPMAITIIGGLVTSTLLSLIVVPVVYALLDDLSQAIGFRLKKI